MKVSKHHLRNLALVTFTLCAAAPIRLGGQPPEGADDWLGFWGVDSLFGPAARGELAVRFEAGSWTSTLAGRSMRTEVHADTVHCAFDDSSGSFRGRLRADSTAIHGHWVQPPGVTLRQGFATPVTLARRTDVLWTGDVAPLDDRCTLNLLIERDADGGLVALVRDPLRNRSRGIRFVLTRERNRITFTMRGRTDPAIQGTYDPARDCFALEWPGFEAPLVARKLSKDAAAAFLPCPPGSSPAVYRQPTQQSDGWTTARAATVGMSEGALAALVKQLSAIDPTESGALLLHSILIARHGKLVLEEYFYGFDRNDLHDLRSGSKTFTSVLAGVAIDQGALRIDSPVVDLFPEYGELQNLDERKQRITVGELLDHSSGLACDDNDESSPGEEGAMQSQSAQPDWYRYMLDLPMTHEPGTTYAYCSGGMNLAGGAVRNAMGMWLPDIFDRFVAQPLQIEHYHMNLMPTGEAYSGGGLRLRPRDFLKLGQAYLDGGAWNGRRLVSRDWVESSTAHQIDANSSSSDGYGWHRYVLASRGRTYQEYEANGNGGQFLIVLPELDTAIVFTAGNYVQYSIWRTLRDEIVPTRIIAAIVER